MSPNDRAPAQPKVPYSSPYRIVTGSLKTTVVPTAVGLSDARDLLNCDTGKGDFRLDLRHRRFAQPPLVDGGSTGMGEGMGSEEARTGATLTWASLSNIDADSDVASCVGFLPGLKSKWLKVSGLTLDTPLAGGSAVVAVRVVVRHRRASSSDVFTDISLASVESGALTLSPDHIVPSSFEDYVVDLTARGLTVSEINAGFSLRLAYDAEPDFSDAFNPLNWVVDVSPASPVTGQGHGTLSLTQAWTITPTWSPTTGGAIGHPSPLYTPLSIHSYAQGQGTGGVYPGTPGITYATAYDGNAEADNGIGTVVSGPIGSTPVMGDEGDPEEIPQYQRAESTAKRRAIGSYVVTSSASATVTGVDPQDAVIALGLDAVVTNPDESTLEIESITLEVDYTDGVVSTDPDGIVYASYGGTEEYAVVSRPGAFVADASSADAGYSDVFGADQAPTPLVGSGWVLWVFDGKVFYTNPEGGTWYRFIGESTLQPLYRDVESPGSSGDAYFVASSEWLDIAKFDPAADVLTMTTNAGAKATDTTSGLIGSSGGPTGSAGEQGYLRVRTDDDWFDASIVKATPVVVEGADAMGIILTDKAGTSDGYSSKAADNFIVLKNSAATSSGSLPIKPYGKLDSKGGSYYGWVDLSGVSPAILADLKTIEIRVGIRDANGIDFDFEAIVFGGVRYKDTTWGPGVTSQDTEPVVYAYRYTEGATIGNARTLTVPSTTHLGARLQASAPFMGAALTVTVPVGDAPFTSAATIELYRQVGGVYQLVDSALNTESLVYEDVEQDDEIASAPAVPALDFDEPEGSFSGQVTGIVAGCAWKGSNVYSGLDGKVYGSRTGAFQDVLWDDVAKTNDLGSADLSFPRTTVVADDFRSPALALVPGEALYLLTEREAYVMVGGETFGTSSFPRKIDGGRGVLGIRAACSYGDACLYGAKDGLWYVRKTSVDNSQPDTLTEITKENREAWLWLLGASPSTVVVRQRYGEIWAFNGSRYLHLTRENRTIKGVWVDGRTVVDATLDPERNLILQLSDGSLSLVGPFPTDAAYNVEGTDGVEPIWFYRTGIEVSSNIPTRAVVMASLGAGGTVSVRAESEDPALTSIVVSGEGTLVRSIAFERKSGATTTGPHTSALAAFTIQGRARDRVLSVEVELAQRKEPLTVDSSVDLP